MIQGDNLEVIGQLTDSTPLISSGLIDSQRLVDISLMIEEALGHEADFSAVDLEKEWETIANILEFVETHRQVR